jgi:anti-sigma regulatory factor (Ser/Thr protein kinase)
MSASGRIKLQAVLGNLQAIMDCVTAAASAAGFSARRMGDMELAVEEAVTNVFKYASPGNPGDIEVVCAADAGEFRIEIRDSGKEFDITKLPDPDLSLDISERPIGGLGVYLIKKKADAVTYRRLPGLNVLALVFNLEIKKQP